MPRTFLGYFITALMVVVSGCGNDTSSGNPASSRGATVTAPVAEVRIAPADLIHESVGIVRAVSTSTISSKLMGTVSEIRVKEGDRFIKGELLIVIDPRQVTAQLQQAEAALAEARQSHAAALSSRKAAQADSHLSRETYERYLSLLQEGSASRQEFDEIQARHLQAEAALTRADAMVDAAEHRIEQAKAAAAAVKVNRQDASITAPYDGWVAAKLIDEGSLAAPGTPLLVLEGLDGYRIETVIPEKYIGAVSLNQTVRVRLDGSGGTLLEGSVEAVAPAADSQSHTFLVKIAIPQENDILSGMFAKVEIPLGRTEKMMIPSSAVIRQGQLTGVFLVDNHQVARFRLIRTGRIYDHHIEVLSGLKPGDRYVVAPPVTLMDGAAIKPSGDTP